MNRDERHMDRLEVHHHFALDPALERALGHVLLALGASNQRIIHMFEDLEAKVAKLTSASDSAEALLDGIKAKLDDLVANGGMSAADKAKVAAISAAIDKEGDDLAAAVVRNTPAETPPTP